MIIFTLKKELKTFTLEETLMKQMITPREEWFPARRSKKSKKRARNSVNKVM